LLCVDASLGSGFASPNRAERERARSYLSYA
jgi:hypothetical protein